MHETLNRYFRAIRELDREAFVGCFAEGHVEHHDPVGSAPHHSRAQIGEFFDQLAGLFASVELKPDKIYPGGDGVALSWTGRGRGKNGREVTFEGIDVFVLTPEGLIRSLHAYWDMAPTMAELMA